MPLQQPTGQHPLLTEDPLAIVPPFTFNGLSARFFPLAANLDTMQQLCNSYLNFVPPEVGRFRVAAPFAYLAVLNYEKIAELSRASSVGWFAQVEMFFAVPLMWYKVINGNWVFHDFAVITPFVYVNDSLSIPMGRGAYGFPKALVNLQANPSRWTYNPVAPLTVARAKTAVFPRLYEGKKLEQRPFLEVEIEPSPLSSLRLPPQASSPLAPWTVATNLGNAMGNMTHTASWLAQAQRVFPGPAVGDPAMWPAMVDRLLRTFEPGAPGFVLNSLNLKQFRASEDPAAACYQSLTNGRMTMTGFEGAGALGAERLAVGDLSGGYRIKLHEYESLPIAKKLGLQVHEAWDNGDTRIVELKPIMPFWLEANVEYNKGENLAWRKQDGLWRDGTGQPFHPPKPNQPPRPPVFNTSVNSVVDDITGPYRFFDTTMRVLPLVADGTRLQEYLDSYVNTELKAPIDNGAANYTQGYRLTLWSGTNSEDDASETAEKAHVYLSVSSYGAVSSSSNNVGDWIQFELTFLIPIKVERLNDRGEWEFQTVGVLPAFNFVDDSIAAITRHEVQGIKSHISEFIRPANDWLSSTSPRLPNIQQLLTVNAEVMPALGVGEQSRTRTIVEIAAITKEEEIVPHKPGDDCNSALTASEDSQLTEGDLTHQAQRDKNETAKKMQELHDLVLALSSDLLLNQVPFEYYTLKQFRDVSTPSRACFQSLQRIPRTMDSPETISKVDEKLLVRIHDFPTLKIVEKLGIKGTALPAAGSGVVFEITAENPFYVDCTLDEGLGEPLLSRAESNTWSLSEGEIERLKASGQHGPQPGFGAKRTSVLDRVGPQEVIQILFHHNQEVLEKTATVTEQGQN